MQYFRWHVKATAEMCSPSLQCAASDHVLRHCHCHHVGSGSGQSRSRNPEPSLASTAVFIRSANRFTVFTFNFLVTCCVAFWLVEVSAFRRISTFRSTSYGLSHAEKLGPRPAEDRGHSQRRRRQGEGVRWGGGRGAPRGGGGRRQGGLEGNKAYTDGGSAALGPQGSRGVGCF